MKHHKKWNWGK